VSSRRITRKAMKFYLRTTRQSRGCEAWLPDPNHKPEPLTLEVIYKAWQRALSMGAGEMEIFQNGEAYGDKKENP